MTEIVNAPKTWERTKPQVEFEVTPRTRGPFTEVIKVYFNKRAKILRRPASRNLAWSPKNEAVVRLTEVIAILEDLNGVEA